MARFFITLAYNGEKYVGWQVQPNGVSVQQMLEEALSTISRQPLKVVGAGRTDAGVHARAMVAHFDWEGEPFSAEEWLYRLNNFLPRDIALSSIRAVQPDAHARFSALARTYAYYVTTCKDPFLHPFHYRLHYTPDIILMNRLGEVLKEYEDFTSFSKLHSDAKTNNCRVTRAEWKCVEMEAIDLPCKPTGFYETWSARSWEHCWKRVGDGLMNAVSDVLSRHGTAVRRATRFPGTRSSSRRYVTLTLFGYK